MLRTASLEVRLTGTTEWPRSQIEAAVAGGASLDHLASAVGSVVSTAEPAAKPGSGGLGQ